MEKVTGSGPYFRLRLRYCTLVFLVDGDLEEEGMGSGKSGEEGATISECRHHALLATRVRAVFIENKSSVKKKTRD